MTTRSKLRKAYLLKRHIGFRLVNLLRRGYIIDRYLENNPVAKLHLACGERIINGWLNVDLYVGDIYLNARKRFPFDSETFNYIYTHHFIEHLPLDELESSLSEMYRILKEGGKIRIVTPGLEEMIGVYRKREIDVIEHYCRDTKHVDRVEFFNQEFRQNGEHKYIYDYGFLKKLLMKHKFTNVRRFDYGKSEEKAFNGIDRHGYKCIDRISLCVEGKKC